MILPIYLYGNPVLRKKSIDIDKDYANLNEIINNMFETMYKSDGIGLAAPQIGLNINLITIDARVLAKDEPEMKDFLRVFINPKITFNTEDTIAIEEGCLSLPSINEDVDRIENLTIEYYDRDFNKVTENLIGYPAIIVQHEYDHLNGIVFIDRISTIRKRFIKNKLNNITKGKVATSYKVKL
ncbi:MAG: peptide deformylase [Bacteroidales bacterium]|nr:peptide deformylase [Bacteroidales bacterium]MDD4217101.1 peptide deformylase [Bacteroidales bacterium]MDY0142330.1 peptide deformylase [Bacteroidales bacterium]